ncbi:MAG: hypothetical protein HY042_13065 [Spirochaetia bacterium]|nr:hypothetical protein [Spirochaetia bacterium]
MTNLRLTRLCRDLAPDAVMVATAESRSYVERLLAVGADEVLLPFVAEGERLAESIAKEASIAS